MNAHHAQTHRGRRTRKAPVQLYFFAGFWLSFVVFVISASMLIPPSKKIREASPALLYKVAINEELRRAQQIPSVAKALVINLDDMTLALYSESNYVRTYPIVASGQKGSVWELPSGKYTVTEKETVHRSPITGAWLPYTLRLSGNFFIHGWPMKDDGTEFSADYLGDTVRLFTPDARAIFRFAETGIPVYVTGGPSKNYFATSSRYYLRGEGRLPSVSAQSFLVADVNDGTVLWERNASVARHPGELTALPAALAALSAVNQYATIHLSTVLLEKKNAQHQAIGNSDAVPTGALLYPLLVDTNDTAAKALARTRGESHFANTMNAQAAALGLSRTSWSGALSTDDATTTARDLFTLARYVAREQPFLLDTTRAEERQVKDPHGGMRIRWENKNPWVKSGDTAYRGGLVGIKGDGSGSALVLFALPLSEFDERTIAFVVLDSRHVILDVERLRAFVEEHYIYGIAREGVRYVPDDVHVSLTSRMKAWLSSVGFFGSEVAYERER